MSKPTFPYRPELDAYKAQLFAKCFSHCIQCEEFELSVLEQTILIQFCNRVDEKSFIEEALKRLEEKKENESDSAWALIEAYEASRE